MLIMKPTNSILLFTVHCLQRPLYPIIIISIDRFTSQITWQMRKVVETKNKPKENRIDLLIMLHICIGPLMPILPFPFRLINHFSRREKYSHENSHFWKMSLKCILTLCIWCSLFRVQWFGVLNGKWAWTRSNDLFTFCGAHM